MKYHIPRENNILSCIYFTSFVLQREKLYYFQLRDQRNGNQPSKLKERVLLYELLWPVYETERQRWNSGKCSAHYFCHLTNICLAIARSQIHYTLRTRIKPVRWLTATDSFTRVVGLLLAFRKLIYSVIMPQIEKLRTVISCRKRQ